MKIQTKLMASSTSEILLISESAGSNMKETSNMIIKMEEAIYCYRMAKGSLATGVETTYRGRASL